MVIAKNLPFEEKKNKQCMLRAIALSEKGRNSAPPNPWVGCIIMQGNQLVGQGYHLAAGQPHAEVVALRDAGKQAEGATVFITLEPCCHHGRTPPCVQALIASKVARVVVALEDPDPRVSGKGILQLQHAGIAVDVGVCAEEAAQSLHPYLVQRKTGLPFCLAKAAISIDGKIAAADGSSQWITSKEARLDAHHLRAQSQAILIGSGTVASDNPKLTIRNASDEVVKQPLRVILDARGQLLPPKAIFDTKDSPTLMITSSKCPQTTKNAWLDAKVEIAIVPLSASGIGLDLLSVMRLLGERGIIQVLVEGGSTLMGSFLEAQLIDRLTLYMGPRILGEAGLSLFKNFAVKEIEEAPYLRLINSKQIGDCIRLDYDIPKKIHASVK